MKAQNKSTDSNQHFDIDRLRSGDRAALRELVEAYQGRVYNLALRMLWNKEDAEDVLQETFLKVIDKITTFRKESAIGTWIYRITANAALMKLRERRRQRGRMTEFEDMEKNEIKPSILTPTEVNPFDELLGQESKEILEKAIDGLPEIYRVVFVLKDIEQLSTEEVAAILDLTHEAVYSRLKRARMYLREAILSYYREEKKEIHNALP